MKSRILNLSLIAIAVVALTACGGGDDNKTTTPSEPATPIEEPTTPTQRRFTAFFETMTDGDNTKKTITGELEGSFASGTYTLTFANSPDNVFNQTATKDDIKWNNAAGGGRSFLDAKALLACTSTGSSRTNIALRDAAEVDFKQLAEKTFIGYSCGKKGNGLNEIDGIEVLVVNSDGTATSNDGGETYKLSTSDVVALFGSGLYDPEEKRTMRGKAYKIGGEYVIRTSDVLDSGKSAGQVLYIETTLAPN